GRRGLMDAGRWAVIKDLFNQALEAPAEARAAVLADLDPGLRAEVEVLLGAFAAAGSFLERGPGDLLAAPRLPPGARVGRYEILGFLGAGGMGQVYRARDAALGRPAALKLLGHGDLPGRLGREGEALARLQHPAIATFFEAGTDGDTRFIAMELVPG